QSSNWSPDDERWPNIRAAFSSLTQAPRIRILSLAGEDAENQSIRIHSSRRSGASLLLDLEITRSGDATRSTHLPVTTHLNGAGTTDSIAISGQQIRFQRSLALDPDSVSGHGWVSLPGDGNLRDNVAFFAYGPARPVKSLIVGPANEASKYLALSAAPGSDAAQTVDRIEAETFSTYDQSDLATIFWTAPLPDPTTALELRRFLDHGGQVILFPPLRDGDQRFLDIAWSPLSKAPSEQFFILDSWDKADGLLRNGMAGTPLPADRLRAIQRRIPLGEATTLARWDDLEPFLVRQVVGRGTAWFVGSTPDYRWSNLGDADVLLPLAQRAVAAGVQRFDSGSLRDIGSATSATESLETMGRLDTYESTRDAAAEYLAGVYRLDDQAIAFNRPAHEDLKGIIEEETLAQIFATLPYSLFEDRSNSANETVSRGIWRAFLVAMLFFLLSEALLCLPRKPAPPAETATPKPA
ncbi:MAG: hypothetical protein ACQKBU_00940, partial [Verrucomicrobiales bacterium]